MIIVNVGTILSGSYVTLAAETEVVREESTDVPAWSATVIQRHHGPPESDAILIDLFLVQRGKSRLVAKDLIGPIVLFDAQRKILSCESEDAMSGQRPILLDLNGRRTPTAKHPGYLRGCSRIERSDLVLLHYNLVADGKPYNLVRVLRVDGKLVLERKLDDAGELIVSEGGRTYRVRVPTPEFPG